MKTLHSVFRRDPLSPGERERDHLGRTDSASGLRRVGSYNDPGPSKDNFPHVLKDSRVIFT